MAIQNSHNPIGGYCGGRLAGVDVSEPVLAEIWTEGPAQRFNVANSVRVSEVSSLRRYGFP
jgi:hypothetical protein